LQRAASADAVLAFMTDCIDASFVARCKRLRVVACALKGYDNFDLAACSGAGIWVTIVPDLLTEPTAELAVGLAIGLARNIRDGDARVRSGKFDGWRPDLYGTGLDQSAVAIVGMGHVGRAVAQRLKGFGCRLFGVDPGGEMPEGVLPIGLNQALEIADFVILCVPLTPAAHHQIGAQALSRMKPEALLINVGRGSVVDESAVLAALENSALAGYAADVFEMEDWALPDRPIDIDSRLRTHPRALFTPHLGSAVARVRRAIEMRAVDNIADVLEGRRPRDAINEPRHALLPVAG
jgi:phosphonate dehydrogenase